MERLTALEKRNSMGAGVREGCSTRMVNMLTEELNIPIIYTILDAYQEGDGSLPGVLMATPRETLVKLDALLAELEGEMDDQGEIDGEYIGELVEELRADIRTELFIEGKDETQVPTKRTIDMN
jgi:hypothetical protein